MTSSQLDSAHNPLRSVWTARWVIPHESAFIWLEKYAWANLAGASAIARDLFGRSPPQSGSYDLLWGRWIKPERLRSPPDLPLTRGLMSAYGEGWPACLASGKHFRF